MQTLAKKELKTNAMRILDKNNIIYKMETYDCDEFIDGITAANISDTPHELVYKTLVTIGKTKKNYVFVIPIEAEIDFKKAAKVVGEKSLEMLPLKELTSVTGYVRGGCTSIGMKKQYQTVIDDSAEYLDNIYISGGRVGLQLYLSPLDLQQVIDAKFADVVFK